MGITHLSGLEVAGVPTMGVGGAPFFTGNWWFVDPLNGSDGNSGAADSPFQTIYQGYNKAVADNNDVVILVGSGDTSGTARLSVALAQTINPAATTGTVTWAKNATHLVGMTAPTLNCRARFAPPTGTYTAATFGNAGNFFNVTASGCYFANFSLFNGFSTGATGQICWQDSGSQNYYDHVHFGGMGDTASAASTTSACISLVGSGGEREFVNCTIGLDTVQRTGANSSLIVSAGTPRNSFRYCRFISDLSSGATAAAILTAPSASIDRWIEFDQCRFLNSVKSSGSAMAQAFVMTASGGLVLVNNCGAAGITAWETSTSGFVYVTGAVPTFATSGIGKAS